MSWMPLLEGCGKYDRNLFREDRIERKRYFLQCIKDGLIPRECTDPDVFLYDSFISFHVLSSFKSSEEFHKRYRKMLITESEWENLKGHIIKSLPWIAEIEITVYKLDKSKLSSSLEEQDMDEKLLGLAFENLSKEALGEILSAGDANFGKTMRKHFLEFRKKQTEHLRK